MFHDIIEPSTRVRSRKALVLPLSIMTHALLVGIILLVSVIAPDVLPMPATALIAFVTRDIVLPPPPAVRQPVDANKPVVDLHPNAAPLEPPSAIAPESLVEPAPVPVGTVDGVWNAPGGIGDTIAPPPPPPPLASAPAAAPVRVGGDIRPPTKIKDARPVYPSIAQAARVEGMVIIETTIGPTGRVLDARVIKSIPLLDAAALEAVRQWEFTPTLLNGSPVPVVLTVTVNFALR